MTFHEFKMQEGCPATNSEPVDGSDIVSRLAIAGIAEQVDVDQSQKSRPRAVTSPIGATATGRPARIQ
jgi:hypothetical protein